MVRHRQSVWGIGLRLAITAWLTSIAVDAQGPVYRERWGYLHLENRRAEVFDELRGRSSEDLAKVSALLADYTSGIPFIPVAKALAFLRGVPADDAFLMRAALGTFVLPEVVDPNASLESCRSANFSVFLPFSLKAPGAMTFELVVRNVDGEKVWSELVTENVALADIRMGQAHAGVPSEGLPDGTYEVQLRSFFDGAGPREHDPDLRWDFCILRGYQERAEAALASAIAARQDADPLAGALISGFAEQVSRAYTGEAFAVRSNAVRELEQLELCLENVAKKRSPLLGMSGSVVTALPGGDIVQPCVLRLPKDRRPHPSVLFVTGLPAYDVGSNRPMAPAMREASWLMRELGDFGVAEQWHLACFDSPGGGRPYAKVLLQVLKVLPQLLPTDGQKPLLVCDREAASIVGMQLLKFKPHISGVVFVGSGAMPVKVIAQLGKLPVRFVSLSGYPGSVAVDRTLQYLDLQRAAGEPVPDVSMLHDREEPWMFGVSRSLDEIHDFTVQLFGRR